MGEIIDNQLFAYSPTQLLFESSRKAPLPPSPLPRNVACRYKQRLRIRVGDYYLRFLRYCE